MIMLPVIFIFTILINGYSKGLCFSNSNDCTTCDNFHFITCGDFNVNRFSFILNNLV